MLRDLWDRLLGRERDRTVARETEREQMSPAERHLSEESIDDFQADEFVSEHLGGIDPERLSREDEPPRD
jgi:hypothetical protein